MKKKLALILAGLLCIGSFTSCAPSSPSSEKDAAKCAGNQSEMVIAVS